MSKCLNVLCFMIILLIKQRPAVRLLADKSKNKQSFKNLRGVLTSVVFSQFKSNSGLFSHIFVFCLYRFNTVIALGYRPKQPHRDLLEEVVSVRFMV